MFAHESEQHRTKVFGAEGHRRGDAQAASQRTGLFARRFVDRLLHAREYLAHAFVEALARVGDGNAARRAMQQFGAQFAFEPRDARAELRLRHVEPRRRRVDAAAFDHFDEGADVAEVVIQ